VDKKAKVDKQAGNNGGKKLGGVTGKGFLPGKSGNPKGRARRKTADEILRSILEKRPTVQIKKMLKAAGVKDIDTEKPVSMLLFEVAIARALAGNYAFFETIVNRVYGKVPDIITGPDGGDISITVQYVNRPNVNGSDSGK
jgi:hypothetical protein